MISLVDDDVVLAETIEMGLEVKGYRVILAGNAQDGIERAKEEQPALLIRDGQLPGMHGDVAIRELRAMGLNHPMVALGADGDRRESMMGAGADVFSEKPMDMPALIALIRELIA